MHEQVEFGGCRFLGPTLNFAETSMHEQSIHLYTTREAAEHLKLTESMLAYWRRKGQGPSYVRIGHHTIRYTRHALLEFISSNAVGAGGQ